MIEADQLERAAASLLEAHRTLEPCAPVRIAMPEATVDDAYVIQQIVAEHHLAGGSPIGRKIGLTSPAVQAQLRVGQPDFGVLLPGTAHGDSEPIPFDRLMQPRVEAEVAFVIGADLPNRRVTVADVLRATDFVVAAIEVVDSRIRDWDISIIDTVADNASSGRFVLGGQPRRLTDIDDLRSCAMTLARDGTQVSAGSGAECLGHPVNAVVWLANVVADRGVPLRSGEIVLSGALGPMVVAEPGCTYEATIGGIGSVRACFTG